MAVLYALGVGPGDPELLTLKAHRILLEAATVYAPRPGTENRSLALEVVRQYLPAGSRVEFLHMPMVAPGTELERCWEEAARQVLDGLEVGNAAFLTLGDPLTYSTAAYLAETVRRLKPETEISFVPGITSYHAAAARVGRTLAEGNETLVVVPSTGAAEYLRQVLSLHDNCVLLKVSRASGVILQVLEELGLKESAVLVSRCGTGREVVTGDLDGLKDGKIDYLSLIIVKGRK